MENVSISDVASTPPTMALSARDQTSFGRIIQQAEPVIALEKVSKRFTPETLALDALSLTLNAGQFLALLGPSGCGKSTTLRLIAGLERPNSGKIYLAGVPVADAGIWIPPESRRVGMVFQDYALFPHLTVADNIAFALQDSNTRRRCEKVAKCAALVGLDHLASRYPHQLSGGQQQRVALARALVADPAVVLLDEPFSNLDAALRETTRTEVQGILAGAQATTILVTHDQEEALSMADVVAVMFDGVIVQVGPPEEIYLRPATLRLATFVGAANIIEGNAHGGSVDCVLGTLPLVEPASGLVKVLVRPEMISVTLSPSGMAQVINRRFFGSYQLVGFEINGGTYIEARLAPSLELSLGTRANLNVIGPVMSYIAVSFHL